MSSDDSSTHPDPDPVFTDAVAVSNHLLEVIRLTYLQGDFEGFRHRFVLPQVLGTFGGERRIETVEDLRASFDATCRSFDSEGVVDMYRRTLSAEFLDPLTIGATYVSAYVLHGNILTEDSMAHGTARLVDGVWKIVESRYSGRDRPGMARRPPRSI